MRLTRRQLILASAAVAGSRYLPASPQKFRLCMCNETFQGYSFRQMCQAAKRNGFAGLEIAPWTLGENPLSLPAAKVAEFRAVMASEGVQYVGMHSLLAHTTGIHITTPDAAVRRRSWEYFRGLIDLCGALGPGPVMVLGSGKQRNAVGGSTVREAEERLKDGLAEVASQAEQQGVTILLEPLAPHLCDVVNSLERGVEIVKEINHPAVWTMFDTHGAVDEKLPHDQLVKKYYKYIRHIHLNEMNGGYPGSGSYDFRPVLQALKDLSYNGWVSVEVFDFRPGGEKIASESARFLRQLEAELH